MSLTELTKITGPGIKTDTNWVGNNANYTGIVTATSFVGSGANLTGIDATSVKDSAGNVKIQAQASGAVYTGIHTFTGDVSIGGTLTYEDVKNVDAVGIVTAREGIFLPDTKKAQFGTSQDLQIYHDGNDSLIDFTNTAHNLRIRGDGEIRLEARYNELSIQAVKNAYVALYYDASNHPEAKLQTSEKGIKVGTGVTIETNGQATYTGIITATSFVGSGTGGIKLPVGTTAQRDNTIGMLRYNSTLQLPEYYNLSLIHI